MSGSDNVARRMAANDRWRRLLADRPPAERRRLDRRAVYAVAVGERLGLDDEALMRLRFSVVIPESDPEIRTIAEMVAAFEARAFPEQGVGLDSKEALDDIPDRSNPATKRMREALFQVQSLIQPIVR